MFLYSNHLSRVSPFVTNRATQFSACGKKCALQKMLLVSFQMCTMLCASIKRNGGSLRKRSRVVRYVNNFWWLSYRLSTNETTAITEEVKITFPHSDGPFPTHVFHFIQTFYGFSDKLCQMNTRTATNVPTT